MKILPGNAINRQYRNAKTMRNLSVTMLSLNTTLLGITALQKDFVNTAVNGGFGLIWCKILESLLNNMANIKDDYQQILERTMQIKKKGR